MPDDEVNRITHLNAMDWYSYDPFAVLDRKDCTVGALRAAAEDHDVSEKPLSTGRYEAAVTCR